MSNSPTTHDLKSESYVSDPERLRTLLLSGLMDTAPTEGFDRYTRVARRLLKANVSLISLVDDHRQYFKSQVGLGYPWCDMGETPLDLSMCATVVETRDMLAIENGPEDPVWRNHPAVRDIGVVSYLGIPIHSPDGHILGSFCVLGGEPRTWSDIDLEVMHDLTQMLEAKIRLRHEIDRRTEIAIRSNETNLRIGEYSERVKHLMATLAHEIRTAVTSLKGHAEIAATSENAGDRDSSLNVIRKNTDYLLNLVNETLESSRIEAGQVRFESILFDPVKISKEIVESLAPNVGDKPVTLRFETAGTGIPPHVTGDPTRIRQILLNLTSNALKFTATGTVTLKLSCKPTQARDAKNTDRRSIELTWHVIDTGPGMTPGQAESLFKPFSQVDASIHRRFGGSGMGLYISRELAKGMGGAIEVESEPGKGSTFRVIVPVHLPTENQVEEITPKAEPLETLAGNPLVLVVEDTPDIQKIQQFLLKRVGCGTVIAQNGREAVDKVRDANRPYDMILMDVHMPEMDGYEATAAIRSLGYDGPLIALSASVDEADLMKMIDAGCDTHLMKPIDLRQFVTTVRPLLDRSRQPADASPQVPSK